MNKTLSVSICIPAYNEGKNIKKVLDGLLKQRTKTVIINKIVVVSSGSTDKTDAITNTYCEKYPHISLIREEERNGKASAINRFLEVVTDDIVVIESADTIPYPNMIENLCHPFLKDKKIGMTGGAPFPINDPDTFLGYIIHAWWWFHRNIPRFGEIIAFRNNIIGNLSRKTAVDEAFIQAKFAQMKFKLVHIDTARVRNKGPETVADLIKQRRRIFNGHSRLYDQESIKIDNMTRSSLKLLLFKYQMHSFKHIIWFTGGILIEIYARFLGYFDTYYKKINPYIWDTAKTTKNLKVDI